MTDKTKSLSEKRAAAGRKGGLAKGIQKSWVAKLPPEERSRHMTKLALKRKAQLERDNIDYEDL